MVVARRRRASPLHRFPKPHVTMVADLPGPRRPQQNQVEITERKQQPAEHAVRHRTHRAPGQPGLHIFKNEDQQSGGRPGSPPLGHHIERARELLQPVGSEAPEITRVFVKRMAEGGHNVGEPTRRQDALDLTHHTVGALDVLEYRVAFDALERRPAEGQPFRVRHYIDARQRKQIDIDIPIHTRACATDVKVPAAERRIDLQFARVGDHWLRRAQQPRETVGPTGRITQTVKLLDLVLHADIAYATRRGSISPAGPRSEQSTSREMGVSSTLISMILALAVRATATRLAAG